MVRLPIPGSDEGEWGKILNEYLSQAHKFDGTLKDSIITNSNLAQDVKDKIDIVAGQQGATGATGPSGPSGAVGATGIAGASGVPGVQGLTGATGPAGADGTSVTITGSVATAAALPGTLTLADAGKGYITNDDGHLHVWSGTNFTDVGTVRGPSGPQGAIGATGSQGPIGSTGATGSAGPSGPSGTPGAVGATGATGPSGASGTPSTVPGPTGATGVTGATGPAGATTINGITGLRAELDGKVNGQNGATALWIGTQTEYDALPSHNATTLYVVRDA